MDGKSWSLWYQGGCPNQLKSSSRKNLVVMDTEIAAKLSHALNLFQVGRTDAAVEGLSELTRLAPHDPQILLARGTILRTIGRLDEALADLDRAVALSPDNSQAHNERGLIRFHREEFDQSLIDLDRAIELDPDCGQALCNRGLILSRRGQNEQALSDFHRALECDPADVSALVNRGVLYAASGQRESALDDLHRAVSLNPTCQSAVDRIIRDFNLGENDQPTPIDEISMQELCERMRLAGLILSKQIEGSLHQATQFMNWLERYRYRQVMPWDASNFLDSMIATGSEGSIMDEIAGLGPVTWTPDRDPDYLFLCTTKEGFLRIPARADDVPVVRAPVNSANGGSSKVSASKPEEPEMKDPSRFSYTIIAHTCEGTGDCIPVCPTECIHWATGVNKKGTRYTFIDSAECINCGACLSVCPIENAIVDRWYPELQKPASQGQTYSRLQDGWRTDKAKAIASRLRAEPTTELFVDLTNELVSAGCDDQRLLDYCRVEIRNDGRKWIADVVLNEPIPYEESRRRTDMNPTAMEMFRTPEPPVRNEGELQQTQDSPVDQSKNETSSPERPLLITLLCLVLGLFQATFALSTLRVISYGDFFPILFYHLAISLLKLAGLIGFWRMSRWGVYLFGILFLISDLPAMFRHQAWLSITSPTFLSLVLLGLGIHYNKKMRSSI